MMSDFRGEGGSKMIPKNRTLEGKNQTLGVEGGSKIVKNCRTSFMYVPLAAFWLDQNLIRGYNLLPSVLSESEL